VGFRNLVTLSCLSNVTGLSTFWHRYS